ncbi:unnamed protein product [Auanema sp. JU1783]|nr:unnamed protein product [Auanema sp. JU1783]
MAIIVNDDDGWWDTAQKEKKWWHFLVKNIISKGIMPKHIAFVMDGNRRFAKVNKLGSALNGHVKGFQQLAKILEWCQDFGIEEVTVYAFSIENFKRSTEEVNGLMSLAEDKFSRLLNEKEKMEEKQISFRFFGNLSLLSPSLRKLILEIQDVSKNFKKGIVNVCMPYTSRDEMERSFEIIRRGVQEGLIDKTDITETLISSCMDSCRGCFPDLFIRTSGEHRMSDFMLWQCSSAHIYFDDVLWPEFDFVNLGKAIVSYQFHHSSIQKFNNKLSITERENPKYQKFYEMVDAMKSYNEM